jgi:hypothetical protein
MHSLWQKMGWVTIWAILGDFGRFWAILGDFGRFWAIFSQIHLVTLCVDLRKKTIPILP